ncbi:MAG TPA: ABC transporter permease [Pseudolysinimonas sp.]|nr:ABC transporter permease [Pseudolysinimonas sp.]
MATRYRGIEHPLRGGWLLVPALAFLAVFFVYPLAMLITRSFTEFRETEAGVGPFGNYLWFFANDANVTILVRTFTTALIVTAVTVLVAYPYAYVMTRVSARWRMVLLAIVLLTFWTSLMVRNYAWLILFQRNGLLNALLASVGLGPVEILGTLPAVVIGMSQILLPFMLLPLYASLSSIDRGLVLAAQSLGARPSVAFLRVYLPLSAPGVAAGGLLVFVLALGFYITPAVLGSPQNSLFSQLIVTQVSDLLAWGRGGAMAVVLFLVTVAMLGLFWLISNRRELPSPLRARGGRS